MDLKYFTLIAFLFYILAILLIAFFYWFGPIWAQTIDGNWDSKSWSNGNERQLRFGDRDPDDDNVELTGTGEAWISGTGTMALSGDAPRFRVVEKDYKNVNITLYAMRVNEDHPLSFAGFNVGARSKHYTNDECYANTYYASVRYDGRISFEKELFHGVDGGTVQFPSSPDSFKYFEDGVPRNEWIGLRFVVATIGNGTSVLLQMYLDPPGGGIRWQKVLEDIDAGHWETDAPKGTCDNYPQNKILQSPGFVFIRNDGLGEAKYKDFSIREMSVAEVKAAEAETEEGGD